MTGAETQQDIGAPKTMKTGTAEEQFRAFDRVFSEDSLMSGKSGWPVSRIMSTSLLTCSPETPIADAAAQMAEQRCSSILILSVDGQALGIWTERDALSIDFSSPDPFSQPISAVMSRPVRMVPHTTRLEEMVAIFHREHVRHYIVSDNGRPVGMVTQTDIVRHQDFHNYLTLRDIGSLTRSRPLQLEGTLPLATITGRLHDSGCEAGIILKEGVPFGVITERDALRLVAERRCQGLTGVDICSHPIIFASHKMPLVQAHDLMEQQRIRHLVICDDQGMVMALLSFSDILSGIELDYTRFLRSALEKQSQALEEGERRQRKILHATQEGFIEVDEKCCIVQVNQAIQQLLGYAEAEMLGRLSVDFCHASSVESYRAELARIPLQEQRSYDVIFRHRSGRPVPLHINATTMRDAATGDVTGAFAFVTDLSRRRQQETRMQSLLSEVSRSNAELESFAYVVSHDLQEPLRMVTSYLGLLERRMGKEISDDNREFMNYAVDGARRMQSMIADLLDYSRINRKAAEFKPCDLNDCVNAALRDLLPAFTQHNGQVDSSPLPTIQAEQGQIVRLLQNLLKNSVTFSDPQRAPRVRISARRAPTPGDWMISVEDNGIGFDPAYSERIFAVFQRLHPREAYPGNGIGLAICKRIVERHHGKISITSIEGKGTTVTVVLPEDPNRVDSVSAQSGLADW